MTRSLSERDHEQLRQFIADMRTRISSLEARVARSEYNPGSREDITVAIPDADINPATLSTDGNTYTATEGLASLFRFDTSSGSPRFIKLPATRGKVKILNLHPLMWAWSNVMVRVSREFQSQRWIIDNLSAKHVVRGVAAAAIAAGSTTGTVNVVRNNATARTVTGVAHTWMDGGAAIPLGTELLMTAFPEDKLWRITEAEC